MSLAARTVLVDLAAILNWVTNSKQRLMQVLELESALIAEHQPSTVPVKLLNTPVKQRQLVYIADKDLTSYQSLQRSSTLQMLVGSTCCWAPPLAMLSGMRGGAPVLVAEASGLLLMLADEHAVAAGLQTCWLS